MRVAVTQRWFGIVGSIVLTTLLLALSREANAQAQGEISYFAPGNILPVNVSGIAGRQVIAPEWVFPLDVGKASGRTAYIGTQLSGYHHLKWNNDPKLFRYPHRDNQCEPRKWKVNFCPSGNGHQGVDIRAHDNSNRKWNVVAVEDGVVTTVTRNTTVAIRNGRRTVRYLHMDPQSIADAGIVKGAVVKRGQVLGKVSNIMGGTPSTSLHLHFDAHTGVAADGNFYHVYPSLIAAYRRSWGLPDLVEGGVLKVDPDREIARTAQPVPPIASDRPVISSGACADAQLADPIPEVVRGDLASLWRHNCSIMGLKADYGTGARSFVYLRPQKSLEAVVSDDPLLFAGTNSGGIISGLAKQYSSKCGTSTFPVSGASTQVNGNPEIVLHGKRPRRDSETCKDIGSVDETLEFSFLERVSPDPPAVSTQPGERKTLSELTRNFLAITFYPGSDGKIALLPYFAQFPGRDGQNGQKDSKGGLIPALSTDEAGVAISWVWINKRALFTNGLIITPRTVSHSMAGVDPSACDADLRPTPTAEAALADAAAVQAMCDAVAAYLSGYIGFGGGRNFAADYFGRQVSIDEQLNLKDPGIAWSWMRTMYSHESGRPVVIDNDVFQRGVQFGNDYIAHFYDGDPTALRPVAFYSDRCNFDRTGCDPVVPATEPPDDATLQSVVSALRDEIKALTAENRKLGELIVKLEQQLK